MASATFDWHRRGAKMTMHLSSQSLDAVARLLLGEDPEPGQPKIFVRRTLTEITRFFNQFGERDLHPATGGPTRSAYTREKLSLLNGTEKMKKVVCRALDDLWEHSDVVNPEHAGAYLNRFLRRDGFDITREERYIRMDGEVPITDPYFDVRPVAGVLVAPTSRVRATHDEVLRHVTTAKARIEAGEYSSAIVHAYTLVETVLKAVLREHGVAADGEGDIRALYQQVADRLNLNPKGEQIESYLRGILQGFKSQLSALYEIANKSSDRHDIKHRPARRHAKLAVNAAFTVCEYVVDSQEFHVATKRQAET